MASKEIKQKIVLDGEKQYTQAIKDAKRELKVLETALKAETAELGKNATEQQKNEVKTKSLKAQIAEQERLVKTLREALAEVQEKYADNEEEISRWEIKLNDARAALADMQNQLEDVGGSFENVGSDANTAVTATKSVADALGEIGTVGGSVSGAIEDIFTSVISTVTDAVEQLWDMISTTAAKANNWTDIANYWGTDAQTIQQYARAVQSTQNSFEDLNSIVSRITLGGKSKELTEMLNISDVNYTNDWDYAILCLNQMYDMAQRGEDLTPIYESIFGEKKATKVMDLLNDWGDIQSLLGTFNGNETGYGMDDKELETMDSLWVKIGTIEQKWDALKDKVAAGFGTVAMDLLVNVEGAMDGIAEYLNADDEEGQQAALDKIRANVEEFFRKVAELIEDCAGILSDVGESLQESDDPLVSAVGSLLVTLANSLQWMIDNADAVKGAFQVIFGAWLVFKLASVAGQLSSIIMKIEAIKAFKGLSTTASLAEAAGTAAGSSWAAGFGAAVLKTIPWLAGIGFVVADSLNNHGSNDIDSTEFLRMAAEGEEYQKSVTDKLQERYGYSLTDLAEDGRMDQVLAGTWITDEDLFDRLEKEYGWTPLETSGGESAAAEQAEQAAETEALPVLTDAMKEAAETFWDVWRDDGEFTDEEWAAFENAFSGSPELFEKISELMDTLTEGYYDEWGEDLPSEWWNDSDFWKTGSNENGVSSSDLRAFNALPSSMQTAVENGAKAGISGIEVQLDGQKVGSLVAPYVSAYIARSISVI